MEQTILQKIIVSRTPPANKRCLGIKDNKFYFWNKGEGRSIEDDTSVVLNERLTSVENKTDEVTKLENKINIIQKQLNDLLE